MIRRCDALQKLSRLPTHSRMSAWAPTVVASARRQSASRPFVRQGSAGARALDEEQTRGRSEVPRIIDRAPEALKIAVGEYGITTELVLSGEWDLAEQPTVRQAVRAALRRCPETLVLDLSQLSFIDASGIRNVLELHYRCAQQDIRLVIIPGPRAVQRPFEISGLIERLPFLGTAA